MGEHEKFLAEVNNPKGYAVVQEVERPVKFVVVGFSVQPIDGLDTLMPLPDPPVDAIMDPMTNPIARAKEIRQEMALQNPHLSTFKSVYLSCAGVSGVARFNAEGRAERKLPPVCKAVRAWLLENFPHSWNPRDRWPPMKIPPRVVFVGFMPARFLAQLAMECSLPENACALPVDMWRKAEILSLIELQSSTTVAVMMKRRMPIDPDDAAVWNKLLEGWERPGQDALKDHHLAIELAVQLGFLVS